MSELTTKEVAERLKIGECLIRRMCAKKQFPNAFKLARDWRIPEEDLELPSIKNRKRGNPHLKKREKD